MGNVTEPTKRPATKQARRAPAPDERTLDAERSRRLLLDAALEEFSAKGYAGARVQDIADRAGVNKQLINYYFGGKEGLYCELHRRWLKREARRGRFHFRCESSLVRRWRCPWSLAARCWRI